MTGQPLPNQTPRKLMSILFGILVGTATIGSVAAAGAAPSDPTEPPGPTRATVRYDLSGSGVAGYVTYQTNNGQSHATNVPLPWSTQLLGWMQNATAPNPYLLSAHTVGPGSITCSIAINGKVVSHNTATGDPARVLCTT
jgi:hypothetical protein